MIRLIVIVLSLWFLLFQAGCQGVKAVDSTRAVEALAAAEKGSYVVMPGELSGDELLTGKMIAFPSVPGKNFKLQVFYPDGTPRIIAETSRSAVVDAVLAGVAGIDAAKFIEDEHTRQWVSAEREAWLALLKPLLDAQIAKMQSVPASMPAISGSVDLKALIKQAVAEAIAAKTGAAP